MTETTQMQSTNLHNQSQVQHIHAYLHPANTNQSYSNEKEKKLKYL